MKNLFLILLIATIFISCGDKDEDPIPASNNNTGSNITVDTTQLFNKTWVYTESPTPGYTYTYKYYFYTDHTFEEATIQTYPDSFNPGEFVTDTTLLFGTFEFYGLSLGVVNVSLNYDSGASIGFGQLEHISSNELHVSGNIYTIE